jgi:hypothetical protein
VPTRIHSIPLDPKRCSHNQMCEDSASISPLTTLICGLARFRRVDVPQRQIFTQAECQMTGVSLV